MKILIVSQYYYPEQFQINDIAPELVRRGHSVTVVCGVPNYPHGVIYDGYGTSDECRQREMEYFRETGVKVQYVQQIPRGNNPICLLLNYLSFARNSRRVIKALPHDYDVVLGYQLSPIISMYAASDYKKMCSKPLVYYVLDLWPVSAEAMLRGKPWPIYSWVTKISRRLYLAADRILVTSRPFMDYLHRIDDVPRDRMGYLPQHATSDMIGMDLKSEDNRVTDFMFAGNLGKGQCLDVIVKAAAELGVRDDYRIHFVGDGRMRGKLETMIAQRGLQKNFVFYGNQKREDMPVFYRKADVLLITLRGNNEVGDTLPGKLQMYMTAGKPILGAINGAAAEVIAESGCGMSVPAGDYIGLSHLMLDYIEHPQKFGKCGICAREYFKEHFTFRTFMDGLESEFEKLISE